MIIPIRCFRSSPWKIGRILGASATFPCKAAGVSRSLARSKPKRRRISGTNGAVSSDELPIDGSIHWHSHIHWSGNWEGDTNAARAVLEHLYTTGELVIHHKKGTRKYYDLADRHIPPAVLARLIRCPSESGHHKWRVLRRIGAVGMLWNRNSDAWLGIWDMKAPEREQVFAELLKEGRILAFSSRGRQGAALLPRGRRAAVGRVPAKRAFKPRCEFIAPLDCMLWDRKLIRALFHFDYTWEIYTPPAKRKYGYYTLPVLYGDRFVGRIEAVSDTKAGVLRVKNVWYEDGVKQTKTLDPRFGGANQAVCANSTNAKPDDRLPVIFICSASSRPKPSPSTSLAAVMNTKAFSSSMRTISFSRASSCAEMMHRSTGRSALLKPPLALKIVTPRCRLSSSFCLMASVCVGDDIAGLMPFEALHHHVHHARRR